MKDVLKNIAYFAWLPFLFMFGVIYFLLTKANELGYKLEQAKAEKRLGDTLNKIAKKKEYADAREQEFDDSYSAYRAAVDELERGKREGSTDKV